MAKSWTERLGMAKRPDAVIDKIIERIEEIEPKLEQLRKFEAELEDMKTALEIHANENYEDASEVSFIGEKVRIDFNARSIVRKVKDVKGLMKALGREVFLANVTFPLAKLDQLIPRELQKAFVSSRRVGARACRITLLSKEKKK